ncbi:LysR family transcriptional regulator [Janthinobacterium fluminis]|uniref:LysR family transcriptional regulator n=1 Tax=Janthinobacterium fluminis TaxID=2987524 RepID=A0ABT5JVY4_9BURK|nr:LysR family transcriptional regulator [Janthinobacterium fluminis]MDC8756894.1 LysR family transcriptional regulator [Janthinobacterium fluminis]
MKTSALNRLDFNLLLDLDALLREGSVVGAARALHLSAPAMSRRLTRLREAIGDPLFVPAGRGLVPTQRALALRERVQAAIEEVRGVFTSEEVDFAGLRRTLTLRANDGFAGAWATRLATAMGAEAPGITLNFIARSDKNIEGLRNGVIDLDIGAQGQLEAEIYSEPLFRAGFVGVVRENHPLFQNRAEAQVNAADFVSWPHISASLRGSGIGRVDTALKELGLHRRVAIMAPGFQAALVMAATSDYIAVLPEPYARWASSHHRLRLFTLPIALADVEVSQSWHKRHHADPVHRWLRGHVRAICDTGTQ